MYKHSFVKLKHDLNIITFIDVSVLFYSSNWQKTYYVDIDIPLADTGREAIGANMLAMIYKLCYVFVS